MGVLAAWVALAVLAAFCGPSRALAQQLPEPRLIQSGERAPFTGQLISQSDLMQWALRIEMLEHRLATDLRTGVERCEVHLTLERARTTAAVETTNLRDGLFTQRLRELGESLVAARSSAVRAWFESPLLWFAVGAVASAAAAIALALSL